MAARSHFKEGIMDTFINFLDRLSAPVALFLSAATVVTIIIPAIVRMAGGG